jgi:hypothetical protein
MVALMMIRHVAAALMCQVAAALNRSCPSPGWPSPRERSGVGDAGVAAPNFRSRCSRLSTDDCRDCRARVLRGLGVMMSSEDGCRRHVVLGARRRA